MHRKRLAKSPSEPSKAQALQDACDLDDAQEKPAGRIGAALNWCLYELERQPQYVSNEGR